MEHSFHFLFGDIEHGGDLFDRKSGFQILENRLDRHTSAFDNPRAAYLAGNAFNSRALGPVKLCHGEPLFQDNANTPRPNLLDPYERFLRAAKQALYQATVKFTSMDGSLARLRVQQPLLLPVASR